MDQTRIDEVEGMYDRIDLGNPEQRNEAAANYVLGLLSSEEKAQFEALLSVSHETQQEVEEWRQHMDVLNSSLTPVEPPKHIWKNIHRKTAPANTFWNHLRFWQGVSFASIAAMFMLVLVNIGQPTMPEMDYVYVVNNQQQNPGWIVNASLNQNKLVMETVQPDSLPKDKACELWLVVEGIEPISLGMLPMSGTKEMSIPKDWKDKLPSAKLVITLENMAGAPSGWDMGPVLNKGNWSSKTY